MDKANTIDFPDERETCGRWCHGTEPFHGFCGCIRCIDCFHWIKRCETPDVCEWRDERDEWTDQDVWVRPSE